MARQKKGDRALGPYRYPEQGFPAYFLVKVLSADRSDRAVQKKYWFTSAATEAAAMAQACSLVEGVNEDAQMAQGITVEEALASYPAFLAQGSMKVEAGRKPHKPKRASSIRTDIARLRNMFPAEAKDLPDHSIVPIGSDLPGGAVIYPRQLVVATIDVVLCERLYERLRMAPGAGRAAPATDTVLNTVNVARQFLDFCVDRRWARANPLAGFRPVGERQDGGKGGRHLNYSELATWRSKAYELAEAGDAGAAAGLIALELGPRATVIVTRRGRDIDLGGAVLHTVPVDERVNRTKRSRRFIPVQDPRLRAILASLKIGVEADGWVFPASRHIRPDRRNFTEAERASILAEYETAKAQRAGKAVLERYQIDAATIFAWRRRPMRQTALVVPPVRPLADPGHRDRSWVAEQIRRVCRAAGVSEDTHAHGMRGAGRSTDLMDGATLKDIEAQLAHARGSKATSAYVSPEAIHRRRQRMLHGMLALDGGPQGEKKGE